MNLSSILGKLDQLVESEKETRKTGKGIETDTETGRIHRSTKNYGGADLDWDSEDEETSSDVKRGRGRPRKNADSETGEVADYDMSALEKIFGIKAPVFDKDEEAGSRTHRMSDREPVAEADMDEEMLQQNAETDAEADGQADQSTTSSLTPSAPSAPTMTQTTSTADRNVQAADRATAMSGDQNKIPATAGTGIQAKSATGTSMSGGSPMTETEEDSDLGRILSLANIESGEDSAQEEGLEEGIFKSALAGAGAAAALAGGIQAHDAMTTDSRLDSLLTAYTVAQNEGDAQRAAEIKQKIRNIKAGREVSVDEGLGCHAIPDADHDPRAEMTLESEFNQLLTGIMNENQPASSSCPAAQDTWVPSMDEEECVEETFDAELNPAKKGMFKGKTKAELQKQYNALKKSGPHKAGSKENTKMKELAFAIRAKSGWGEVQETTNKETTMTQQDSMMESWGRELDALLNESISVTTTSSDTTEPSISVSAQGPDAEKLAEILRHAGLTGGEAEQSVELDGQPETAEVETGCSPMGCTDADYSPEDGEAVEVVSAEGNDIADIVRRLLGGERAEAETIEMYESVQALDAIAARKDQEPAEKGSKSYAIPVQGKRSDVDPESTSQDVPLMAMPQGMGMSLQKEDEQSSKDLEGTPESPEAVTMGEVQKDLGGKKEVTDTYENTLAESIKMLDAIVARKDQAPTEKAAGSFAVPVQGKRSDIDPESTSQDVPLMAMPQGMGMSLQSEDKQADADLKDTPKSPEAGSFRDTLAKLEKLAKEGTKPAKSVATEVAEESTAERDDRAEAAGEEVTKDIEYDERKRELSESLSDEQEMEYTSESKCCEACGCEPCECEDKEVDECDEIAEMKNVLARMMGKKHKKVEEAYANEADDTFVADSDYMINDITSGLNKRKSSGQSVVPTTDVNVTDKQDSISLFKRLGNLFQ